MNTISNKVQLIGNLGQDPQITNLENGRKMARISIATTESYLNKSGERISDTQWHNVVAWNKTAELLEKYTQKGHKIGIEGKLSNRSYEDKNGQKQYITEVVANEVLLLTPKSDKTNNK